MKTTIKIILGTLGVISVGAMCRASYCKGCIDTYKEVTKDLESLKEKVLANKKASKKKESK